jgi:hypothetical protein
MRATDHLYVQALRDAARVSAAVDMMAGHDRARLYDASLGEQTHREARRTELMRMAGLFDPDPAAKSVAGLIDASIGQSTAAEAMQRALANQASFGGLAGSDLELALASHSMQAVIAQTTAAVEARRALTSGLSSDLYFADARRSIPDVINDLTRRSMMEPRLLTDAYNAAKLVHAAELPTSIDAFRTSVDSLTARMALGDAWRTTNDPVLHQAFGHTASIADLLYESTRVDRYVREALAGFQSAEVPAGLGLAQYRGFLDSAGLILPRVPRLRTVTAKEKRQRLRAQLQDNRETPPIRKAKSLVHQYERTLRDFLDQEMTAEYGEDWAETRLEACGCRDLLGRWRARGGGVFDHADYAHYARIMSYPQHFEAIFEAGFDCPQALYDLLLRAGKLRAASHHANPNFSAEDLRDLRTVWRTIEMGLLALLPDHDVYYDGPAYGR